LRTDSGFGSDFNVDYALDDGWQVLTKGGGGRRPGAYARKIKPEDWLALENERWIAHSVEPPTYVRPVQHLVLRWKTQKGRIKHATLVCSILDWDMPEVMDHYDDRAACEIEIRSDKSGLKMCKRRKSHIAPQEALILLTDVAHNTLGWCSSWMFPDEPFASFGTTRLIQDVLAIPGRLIFVEDRLIEVHLNSLHPHSEEVAEGLRRLLRHFDLA